MVHMDYSDKTSPGAPIRLAFEALAKTVDSLFERHAYDAHPGVGVEGDIHLKAFPELSRELFEDLAGLAHAGLNLVEHNRQWFLAEGGRDSYRFWYTLALAASKAASGHADSAQPARVPEEPVRILFGSLLEFLPYACIQPGDWVMRTADALAILYAAFPLDGLRELVGQAEHSASVSTSLLSAVGKKIEEHYRAAHPRGVG
jgi:hypothetical protein